MDEFEEFARRWEDIYEALARLPKCYIWDGHNPMECFRDSEFLCRYHFSKEIVSGYLLPIVRPSLIKNIHRGLPISPLMKLQVALRFYATSSFQIVCGDLHGVSQSSVSIIVKEMSEIFADCLPEHIRLPNEREIPRVIQRFYAIAGFPGVFGAIDETHIKIKNPGGARGEVYRNRKTYFSINVQVITDSSLRIVDLVVRRPGSCHDARIFQNSGIRAILEEGRINGLLLGDSGYPCREYLFTPVMRPTSRAEHNFNWSHIRTRNVVERAIGIWKQRFPCLRRGLANNLKTTVAVICATGVLHNIALTKNVAMLEDENAEEDENGDVLHPPMSINERGANARFHFIQRHF